MEYCEKGSLFSFILTGKLKKYSLKNKINLLLQISQGMLYLHSKDIIHRDLKSGNIVLDESSVPKITDFNVSTIKTQSKMTLGLGTSEYIAPEITNGLKYSEKCDIFSFSIIMFEVFFNTTDPYCKESNVHALVAQNENFRPIIYVRKDILEKLTKIEKSFIELMKRCWSSKPDERPSFQEIVNELKIYKNYLEENKI
jgi:serine/threonine protein kinase